MCNEIIQYYPSMLNEMRDKSEIYLAIEAKAFMSMSGHLSMHFDLMEELPFPDGVFTEVGRRNLENCLTKMVQNMNCFFSIYICEPYAIVICKIMKFF